MSLDMPDTESLPAIRPADRLAKQRRRLAKAWGDALLELTGEAAALGCRLRGDREGALTHLGRMIRYTQHARESLRPYRQVRRLLDRGGQVLADPAMDAARPEAFVLFIGQGRSGHSLVGSLLDAHPEVVISHELYALKHLNRGAPFDRVADACKLNARVFHAFGRSYTGYDYAVPGQHQGRCTRLSLLGDKKGNGTARLLRRQPRALDRLLAASPVPVVFVHVVRDPYDNIATKARRTGTSPAYAARTYFANAAVTAALHDRPETRVLDVHLEDLIADPRRALAGLLNGLGLDPDPPGYLDACAGILFDRPRRTRAGVAWDPELRRWIEGQLGGYPFLRRYVEGEGSGTAP